MSPQSRFNAIMGLSLLAGACAGAPPSSLKDARSAYERASKSPAQQLAPDQLHAAETFLKTAERTYDDEGDTANMRDRAYVAMRKAQLAEVQARIVQANIQVRAANERGERAEQQAHAATAEELAKARAQLASQRGVIATQSTQLQEETERREQAERAQQQALAALGNVKQESRGTVITLSGSVIFSSGKSELLPAARNRLSEVATALTQGNSNSKIVVEGHTDSVGSPELNQQLSLQRATAVRDALVAQGVAPDRISVQGYGPARPIADNSTPAGRANNRRVEIVVQPAS
jgi:outer membrane protein OmpA-like peptidoglycan-associated protein